VILLLSARHNHHPVPGPLARIGLICRQSPPLMWRTIKVSSLKLCYLERFDSRTDPKRQTEPRTCCLDAAR